MWEAKIPRYYFLIAAGIFILGIAGGAYFGYQKNIASETPEEISAEEAPEVLGGSESLEKLTPNARPGQGAVSGQDVQVPFSPSQSAPGGLGGQAPPKSPPPQSAPLPKPPVPQKLSVCEAAQKELEKQKLAAQKVYDAEIAEFSRQLNELQRQRNEAINNYLTAIAIATSKYNSATSTEAYNIYQQEQSVALNVYTQAVTEISNKEMPLLEAKKASQIKYDEALAAAEAQYQAKNCGS